MANEPISLPDERLNRFEDKLDQVVELLRELQIRQNETHAAVVGVRRDRAHDAGIVAHAQARLDSLAAKIDRIERRLDPRDAL